MSRLRSPITTPLRRLARLVAVRSRQRDDRGDVPGWVLITVVTLR